MDKFEALKASAMGIARLLGDIASFDSWEIDGDNVEIRFEDENGCDTGTDVSITETADKASQAIGELLAALEEKDQRIKEFERANAAQDDHINQQQNRIDTLEKKNDELGKHVGRLERREEHLKADADVLAQRNKELESDVRVADGIIANHQKLNAELEQRLEQFRIVGHVDNEGGEYTENYGEITESVAIGEKLYSADTLPNLELLMRKVEGE